MLLRILIPVLIYLHILCNLTEQNPADPTSEPVTPESITADADPLDPRILATGPDIKSPVFQFGDPEIFVTTESQNFDPYRLVNKYKRTFMINEYMIFASTGKGTQSHLILYDPEETDIVKQNLGKEQYWAFVNTTGTLPSMTVYNTTFSVTTNFYTTEGDAVSFVTNFGKSFASKETSPPYDVDFEIPANSGTFRTTKTAVDFQSWGLLRWQLSEKGFVTWDSIKESAEALFPVFNTGTTDATGALPIDKSWNVDSGDFLRIDNPCLPDFFLMYLIVGDKETELHQIYVDIPAFHIFEDSPNFFNLTGSFCPHYHTEAHEECGFVQQLLVTNDHIVALTDKGLYISSSLNSSDVDVSGPYEEKPLISYELVDPCSKFAEYISCFKQGLTSLASQLIHSIRLFYTPICNLYQLPFYEDRMIFVVEHTTTGTGSNESVSSPPVRAVTILYSSTPYKDWRVLFVGIDKYNGSRIMGLVGVFFNHQLRHFDITLKVMGDDGKNFHYRRFILPDIGDVDSEKTPGYAMLNGLLGKGFLEKRFPGTFKLEQIVVNPGTMDVFFMGSQLWISESAGPIVYTSLAGLTDKQSVKECSFNHPDRNFVCVNSDSSQLIVGRIGSQYSPYVIDVESIEELWEAGGMKGAYWTEDYAEIVIKTAHYTAAYSGHILLWYLYDPKVLRESQKKLKAKSPDCEKDCKKCLQHQALLQSCNQLKSADWVDTDLKIEPRGPYFRMVSINPYILKPRKEPTAGPLAVLYIDAGTVLLYEGRLPGDDAEYVYFSGVHIGEEITCGAGPKPPTVPPTGPVPPTPPTSPPPDDDQVCRIYIRHIKPVDKFLDGFRQILYGTLIKPMPLEPLKEKIFVLQVPNSNLVLVRKIDGFFDGTAEIGKTHLFPGFFSVLLQGLPVDSQKDIMWGYSTVHVRTQKITMHDEYETFLIDLSTTIYREKRSKETNEEEYAAFQKVMEDVQKQKQDYENRLQAAKEAAQKDYESSPYSTPGFKLFTTDKPTEIKLYDPIAILLATVSPPVVPVRKKRDIENDIELQDQLSKRAATMNSSSTTTTTTTNPVTDPVSPNASVPASAPASAPSSGFSPRAAAANPGFADPLEPWTVSDGGCHHIMQLMPNPVLFSHGGRVSLDLHDALSLTVKLRPITELGRLMLYRPIIVVTNSNPDILRVDKQTVNDVADYIQSVSLTLTPTGLGRGVASLVIRTIITSLTCRSPSSMTFIVQIQRPEGKRLHVKYPIPICSVPIELGGISRPWFTDSEDCIPYQTILDAPDEGYTHKGLAKVFTKLQPNYRPPSHRGEQIPLSKYIYNADPSKPRYNNWYHVTQDSGEYNKCKFRRDSNDCGCSPADRLSDDPSFSDCKQMAYIVKRGKGYQMSFELDPLMKDEDQIQQFHTRKKHLSIYIEEINNRIEYTVISCNSSLPNCEPDSDLLKEINSNPQLNEGKTFYDANALVITLHGTGLYHFKVGVGRFDSFQDISSHFILFSDSNELNHVKLVTVMLITITFCFILVFCGFIRVRRRLSSQLPFQTKAKPKLE